MIINPSFPLQKAKLFFIECEVNYRLCLKGILANRERRKCQKLSQWISNFNLNVTWKLVRKADVQVSPENLQVNSLGVLQPVFYKNPRSGSI